MYDIFISKSKTYRMSSLIPLSFPVFKGSENLYSQQAISSGHIATFGSFINKFESKLTKRLKSHECVALNSGTSAFHLAMVLMGIGSGDEVICSLLLFALRPIQLFILELHQFL